MSFFHLMPTRNSRQYGEGISRGRIRFSVLAGLAVGLLGFLPATPARAEHGAIELTVGTPDGEKEATATTDEEPPVGGVKKPPVLEVKAGEPLVLQFFLTNLYPHGIIKNTTVRYYVVKTDRLGRKPRPELKTMDGVVAFGKATMDFKPKCRVGARLQFRLPEPGLYLVRVETDSHGDRNHEHFATIDLTADK